MQIIEEDTTTEGIVMRSFASGENNLVLRILTAEFGKLSLFVRQARNSKRKYPGNIEIFEKGVFTLKRGKGNLLIIQSYCANFIPSKLRSDLYALTSASMICEVFDAIILENADQAITTQEYYIQLTLSLQAIDEASTPKEFFKICFLTLRAVMQYSGYIDISQFSNPSLKNLYTLIDSVENCIQRALISKTAMLDILQDAQRKKLLTS